MYPCRLVKDAAVSAPLSSYPSSPNVSAAALLPPEQQFEYFMHPAFPELPESAPLTFTLTMHACLSASPADRPTFDQVPPHPYPLPLPPLSPTLCGGSSGTTADLCVREG